jgi:hypothetical protein
MLRPYANMMPCSDARRPIRAKSARAAAAWSPTIARKPSSSGSAETPIFSAPITPVLRNRMSRPVTMSVPRAQNPAFGMSRTGSCASSAASGSSSMPRKNHMAKGSANRIGTTPCGRNEDCPASGSMLKRLSQLKRPEKAAIAEKTSRMAMEMIETTIANLKEIAAPAEFRAMNAT